MRVNRRFFAAAFAAALALLGSAQFGEISSARAQSAAPDPITQFERRTEMVRMRDGVRLHTEILTPRGHRADMPILFMRTPYGIGRWTSGERSAFATSLRSLSDQGYIFVLQDIRGRFRSEGDFVMVRPVRDRSDPRAIDESTDAYDTIEWLLRETRNNGRVGMFGSSYGGWLTMMAAIDPHPALRAAVPQASPADLYIGDDFYHNGAFRLSYAFEYAALMERGRETTPFDFNVYDTYDWYLRLGPIANVARDHFRTPTWTDFAEHPNYDSYWQERSLLPQLGQVRVPSLTVGGWFDQEDGYGPPELYQTWARNDPDNMNFLILGPWSHGGWNGSVESGDRLGAIQFGANTVAYFQNDVIRPFFNYFLKDEGARPPQVRLFETGANAWREYDRWTPAETGAPRSLYLRANGALSFDPPPAGERNAFDRFVSDPAHPVPYRPRPVAGALGGGGAQAQAVTWRTWLVADQRFVDGRPDVLTWVSEPLTEDVVLSGAISAHLFAATTGSDADWVVKLIDVYPDVDAEQPQMSGYQLMVSSEILRGRFREGLETPRRITPNRIEAYEIDLHDRLHRFRAGHRIMVQVQSTWFPLYDRNPQRFVDNIFEARAEDFQAQTHTVHRSPRYSSRVDIRVVEAAGP